MFNFFTEVITGSPSAQSPIERLWFTDRDSGDRLAKSMKISLQNLFAVFFAVFNSLTENGSLNSWNGSLKRVAASFFKKE